MKKLTTALAICIALLGFGRAEGALLWEGDYHKFNYDISGNGGNFYYLPEYYFDTKQGLDKITNDGGFTGNFNATAIGLLPDGFADGGSDIPGVMLMKGTAGGETLNYGIGVKASAQMEATGLDAAHGVQVGQTVTSWANRRLAVDSPGFYNLSADLDGLVDFETFNSGSYFSSFTLSGTVTLLAFTGEGSSVTSLGLVGETIILDESTRHADIEVELLPQIAQGSLVYDVFYQLTATLNLTTDLQNFGSDWEIMGPIPEYGRLGTAEAPLELSATIGSPVPLPGSLLLLFSGLGGLALLRRRPGGR